MTIKQLIKACCNGDNRHKHANKIYINNLDKYKEQKNEKICNNKTKTQSRK